MSVIGVKELFEEQSGLETVGFQREYVTVYHVTTNDQNDGPQIVVDADGLPVIGNQYTGVGNDVDLNAYCVSLTPTRVPGSLYLWRVVAKWTTVPGPGAGGEGSGSRRIRVNKDGDAPTDDPFEFQDEVEVTSTQFTEPVDKAIYISGFFGAVAEARQPNTESAIINSALTVLDPPLERDASHMVIRITTNKDSFPFADAEQYRDAVNSDAFTINKPGIMNRTFQKYTCKLQPIQGVYQIINGINVWRVTYEFHVNKKTWRVEVLDRGVAVSYREGDPNGRGGTVAIADLVEGVPRVRRLLDSTGMPITEPVLLNGAGKLNSPTLPPVYIKYAVYDELPFAALGM